MSVGTNRGHTASPPITCLFLPLIKIILLCGVLFNRDEMLRRQNARDDIDGAGDGKAAMDASELAMSRTVK